MIREAQKCNSNISFHSFAAYGWMKSWGRKKNPKIIITASPPETEAPLQVTERPTEKVIEAVTTAMPVVMTEEAAGHANSENPTEKATTPEIVTTGQQVQEKTKTETPKTTEAVQEKTTTQMPKNTEPLAVQVSTEQIVQLTRPTSVHKFFKQSAVVSSGTDDRTCADVGGQCREACVDTEYLKGRFQCPYPTNCCV